MATFLRYVSAVLILVSLTCGNQFVSDLTRPTQKLFNSTDHLEDSKHISELTTTVVVPDYKPNVQKSIATTSDPSTTKSASNSVSEEKSSNSKDLNKSESGASVALAVNHASISTTETVPVTPAERDNSQVHSSPAAAETPSLSLQKIDSTASTNSSVTTNFTILHSGTMPQDLSTHDTSEEPLETTSQTDITTTASTQATWETPSSTTSKMDTQASTNARVTPTATEETKSYSGKMEVTPPTHVANSPDLSSPATSATPSLSTPQINITASTQAKSETSSLITSLTDVKATTEKTSQTSSWMKSESGITASTIADVTQVTNSSDHTMPTSSPRKPVSTTTSKPPEPTTSCPCSGSTSTTNTPGPTPPTIKEMCPNMTVFAILTILMTTLTTVTAFYVTLRYR